MGLYNKYVLPKMINAGCGTKPIKKQREKVLPLCNGIVLEIGCGSGLNFAFYDENKVEEKNKPKYKVQIDDNFHFMDEDERVFHDEFDTPTQAIVACQKIVDANIESITENETDPDKAYESYVCFGDDPWIEGVEFSASEYAKIKIKEMLKGQNKYPVTVLRARGGF